MSDSGAALTSKKMKLFKLNFVPYMTGELFYDTNAHRLNRQRIYLGTVFSINARYAVKIGWIGQFDKGKSDRNDKDYDILNTGMNFSF